MDVRKNRIKWNYVKKVEEYKNFNLITSKIKSYLCIFDFTVNDLLEKLHIINLIFYQYKKLLKLIHYNNKTFCQINYYLKLYNYIL